jgi:hypothetical protein
MTLAITLQTPLNPHLRAVAIVTRWPAPLGVIERSAALQALMRADPGDALPPDLTGRPARLAGAVRDLLRFHGFKPTGRSKPSSEYLQRAVSESPEGAVPGINVAVDLGNALSLHSGLPLSVIDLDRATGPLSIGPGADGATYVFNRSGQTIDVAGLLSLHDALGPCANPVKDAQRTKTDGETSRTLTIVWGLTVDPDTTARVQTLWMDLARNHGGEPALEEPGKSSSGGRF